MLQKFTTRFKITTWEFLLVKNHYAMRVVKNKTSTFDVGENAQNLL